VAGEGSLKFHFLIQICSLSALKSHWIKCPDLNGKNQNAGRKERNRQAGTCLRVLINIAVFFALSLWGG